MRKYNQIKRNIKRSGGMRKTKYVSTRFEINDDFYVDVNPCVDRDPMGREMVEFVLYMKNYGYKYVMERSEQSGLFLF